MLTWNTYAVSAVRASTPAKFQTDGMLNSVKQGEKLGNRVADWELDHFFQPADS